MTLDHLSASQINMYVRCPAQYSFRYCEQIRKPPTGALTLGSAFHRTTAVNYRQKHESREDMPLGDVLDVFSTEFDRMGEDTEWREKNPSDVKDSGIGALSEYQSVIAPSIQPVEVEERFNMTFKNRSWGFIGIIDLIDEKGMVIETKTTGKTPAGPRTEHLLQTTAYVTGYRSRNGKAESPARIDYAIAKKEPACVSYPVQIEDRDIAYFLNLLDQVARGIENEVWVPNRTQNLCSRRWCGYFNECEKTKGGRVRD